MTQLTIDDAQYIARTQEDFTKKWKQDMHCLLADDILTPVDVLNELDRTVNGQQFAWEYDAILGKLNSLTAAFAQARAQLD